MMLSNSKRGIINDNKKEKEFRNIKLEQKN